MNIDPNATRQMIEEFCKRYQLSNHEEVTQLYEVEELMMFLPEKPSIEEQVALQELIGVQTESGYLDYAKSNNTFELIMQWRERTGNF